jgi:hypothetical protein
MGDTARSNVQATIGFDVLSCLTDNRVTIGFNAANLSTKEVAVMDKPQGDVWSDRVVCERKARSAETSWHTALASKTELSSRAV